MKVLLADEENNQFHVWSMDEDSIIPTDFVTPSGKSRALALSEDCCLLRYEFREPHD